VASLLPGPIDGGCKHRAFLKSSNPPRRTGSKFADPTEKAQVAERAEARDDPSRK
jgi:hypothetical protein